MRYCPHCGEENSDENRNCAYCYGPMDTNDKADSSFINGVIYFIAIICPVLGILFGLLMSGSQIKPIRKASMNVLYLSCTFFLIWLMAIVLLLGISFLMQ